MDNFPLLSFQFVFFFLLFLVGIYASWYLPGRFVIGEKEENSITRILLSFVVGMALWGIQGYVFGYLHVRFFTYIYLFFFIIYYWKRHKEILQDLKATFTKKLTEHKAFCFLFGIGVVLQQLPIFTSGTLYKDGVRFFGVNAFDGVMHLAFIRSIAAHFPPVQPGAFDHPLTNYHYWSDLIIAELTRIWLLPTAHTFFQYLPLIISIFTGIAAYKVVRVFGFSKFAGFWSVFFVYFAGDAAYLLMLVVKNILSFSAPAIDNGVTQFLNMPHAMGKLVFLTSLIPFHYFIKTRQTYWGVLTVILFSVLVGIKVYFGMFAIFGFGLIMIWWLGKEFFLLVGKKYSFSVKRFILEKKQLFLLSAGLLFIAACIYFPPNKSSGGLGFYPLEWPKIFIGTGVLEWHNWWLIHQEYESHNNIKGLVFLDSIAILITLISIHGTRLLGLLPIQSIYKKLGIEKLLFFIPGTIIFHFLGLYTLQESGGLNVFNFFVVGTVILSLFSAMNLDAVAIRKKSILYSLLAFVVIIFTIPRVAYEAITYTQKNMTMADDTRVVPHEELEALTFLREETPQNAIVQSHPQNGYDQKTPYVSYFANRLTYLTGAGMQETHNQPIEEKKETLLKLFNSDHPQTFVTNAMREGIGYIYIRKGNEDKIPFPIDTNLVNPVFENNAVVIYKLQL